MNRTKRYLLSLLLLVALLAIPTVVFAKELGLLTISGPGLKGEVTLKDPEQMVKLEQSGFFGPAKYVKPSEKLGEGYNITAQLNLDGKMVPFVEMVYYPAEDGQPGYVHFTGRLNGESLQKVDQWGMLGIEADRAFRSVMADNKITLQPAILSAPAEVAPAAPQVKQPEPAAEPVAVEPVTVPAPDQTPYIFAAVIAAILLLSAAGLVLRRRSAGQTSA